MHVFTPDSERAPERAAFPASDLISDHAFTDTARSGPNTITEPIPQAMGRLAEALFADAPPRVDTAAAPLLNVLVSTVPGARWVSVTYRRAEHERAMTPMASAEEAVTADSIQYETGEGPCLDAVAGEVRLADEASAARRWPAFAGRLTAETPVRAVLSHPLPGLTGRGSINFYSDVADGFTADSIGPAATAAALSAVAFGAVEARNRADNLTVALGTSRQMGAAIGVLMVQERCTYDQAFVMIRSVSQRSHRKMRDLAEEILLTGALPSIEG
jgi:ANTAR domain